MKASPFLETFPQKDIVPKKVTTQLNFGMEYFGALVLAFSALWVWRSDSALIFPFLNNGTPTSFLTFFYYACHTLCKTYTLSTLH